MGGGKHHIFYEKLTGWL